MMRNTDVNTKNRCSLNDNRGAALFSALAMLFIFSALGMTYLRYMALEVETTRNEVSIVRAQHLSGGGIYAAVAELQVSNAESYSFNLNAYRYEKEVAGQAKARVGYAQTVQVSVEAESGKVNLNHAPKAVLVALGLPSQVVTDFQSKVSATPLLSVDDLRGRTYLSGPEFTALDTSVFTVYGDGKINLNAASPAVLAAVFGLSAEESTVLAAKRPFTTEEDLLAKLAKDPSTFNVTSAEGLSLESTCFRLKSSVNVALSENPEAKRFPAETEAVVSFSVAGVPAIHYWRESSVAAAVEAAVEVSSATEESSAAVSPATVSPAAVSPEKPSVPNGVSGAKDKANR